MCASAISGLLVLRGFRASYGMAGWSRFPQRRPGPLSGNAVFRPELNSHGLRQKLNQRQRVQAVPVKPLGGRHHRRPFPASG